MNATPDTKLCVLCCTALNVFDAIDRERPAESKNVASADTKTGGGASFWRKWLDSTVPLGKPNVFAGEGTPNGEAEICNCDVMF